MLDGTSRVIGARAVPTSPTPLRRYDAVSTSAEGEESLPESRNNLNENTEAVAAENPNVVNSDTSQVIGSPSAEVSAPPATFPAPAAASPRSETSIDPERMDRMIVKLSTIPVREGEIDDPSYRINTITRSTRDVLENLYYFDNKSAAQLIGLINCTFQGDTSVFTNNILSNRAEYSLLEQHVANGNIGHILGLARPEGRDISALDLGDRIYLFGHSLKELLSDNQWQETSGTRLTAGELEQAQRSIDEGVEYVANPTIYRNFISCLRSPQGRELIAPVLNSINSVRDSINYARENPGTAAFSLLSVGTSIAWGVQEGFPVHPEVRGEGEFVNDLALGMANCAALAGLVDSGLIFAGEVRRALAGENPLGRRMVQLGSVALGAYLANRDNEGAIGAEESFEMFGAAVAGISAVVALDGFSSRARPVINSGFDQFSQLVSNSFRNWFPTNNVEGAEAQAVVENDIELGRV